MQSHFVLPYVRLWIVAVIGLVSPAFSTMAYADAVSKAGLATATESVDAALDDGPYDDGPYATYQRDGNGLEVTWVCKGRVQRKALQKVAGAIGMSIAPECGYARPITVRDDKPSFPVPVKFTTKKLVALSDIHGQFELIVKLFQQNGVIDRDLKWAFGDGHMVIIGDSFDRGPKVTELLWFLYALEAEARAAGGAVHLLLGNHETMVFYEDLRYVNPKYAAVAKLLDASHTTLFNAQSVLGRWLRTKPVMVQVNDMLFVHGGLSPQFAAMKMSVAETNEAFRATLGQPRSTIRGTSLPSFLYGASGPIWYRGYFNAPKIESAELDALLAQYAVKRMVVGHTTLQGVFSHYGGRVINTDTDLQKGKSGELFFWEVGKLSRGTLSGERSALSEYVAPAPTPTPTN